MIQPRKQTVIYIKTQVYTENDVTGILQASPDLEDNNDLIIFPALMITQNRKFTVLINIFLQHTYTLKKGFHIATFSILTPKQAEQIKPFNPAPSRHLSDTNLDNANQYVIALLKMP